MVHERHAYLILSVSESEARMFWGEKTGGEEAVCDSCHDRHFGVVRHTDWKRWKKT